MRPRLVIATVFGVVALAACSYAFGWAEGGVTYLSDGGDPMDCPACHAEDFPVFTSRLRLSAASVSGSMRAI